MKQWYALHTRPRAERVVAAAFTALSIENFLPELPFLNQRDKQTVVPFFPGYFFAQLDLQQGRGRWQWTPGFRYIVSYGDWPAPVPAEIVNLISSKMNEMSAAPWQAHYWLQPGDLVRIGSGPFAGLLAVFEEPSTPTGRVRVLLTALQRAVRLELDSSYLEKVASSKDGRLTKPPRRTRGRGRPISQAQRQKGPPS